MKTYLTWYYINPYHRAPPSEEVAIVLLWDWTEMSVKKLLLYKPRCYDTFW